MLWVWKCGACSGVIFLHEPPVKDRMPEVDCPLCGDYKWEFLGTTPSETRPP